MRREAPDPEPPILGQGTWRSIEFQATVALAAMLTPLNSTLLAVGLPAIRSHFDVGVGEMTLLISVYLVAVAAMQPVSGRLGDAFGSIRMMMLGLVLLIAISAVSALATNFPMLILMRGLQGAATALVLPNGIAVLRKRTPSARLGTVLGMNGAALSIAAAVGPVVGGALLLAGDWRLLFLVNVPLSVLAIAMLLRVTPDAGQGRATLNIDLPSLGALVLVFASAVLIGSATRVENPAFLIVGGALLPITMGAYWLRSRWGGSIVEFRFFRARNFRGAATSQGLTNLVMYSFLVSLPLYLVDPLRVERRAVSPGLPGNVPPPLSFSAARASPGRLAVTITSVPPSSDRRTGPMRRSLAGLRNTRLIARRQLGAIRQDGYVVFLLGLVVALGLVAALGARHHAANETEQRDRYQAMVDRQWVEQPERHPHRVIHYGFLVFREQAPLEFVDPGVSDYAGTSLYLEGHRPETRPTSARRVMPPGCRASDA